MTNNMWEKGIIIPRTKNEFTVLPPVIKFATQEHFIDINALGLDSDISTYLKKDTFPIPTTEDREGYYENRHYDFWLSGIQDYLKIKHESQKCLSKFNHLTRILDFGCATGRVLRHFAIQENATVWGCDINENHVNWCNSYLPATCTVFQSSSLPQLQAEDNWFDVIYALSVFSHIDTFETSWLCELRRVLKKGGIAYITIHDESSWANMPRDWGVGQSVIKHPEFKQQWLKEGFPGEKFVSRWHTDKSYSANVFYKISYIHRVWGKLFEVVNVIPMGHNYQTVLVLKKSS